MAVAAPLDNSNTATVYVGLSRRQQGPVSVLGEYIGRRSGTYQLMLAFLRRKRERSVLRQGGEE